MQILNDISAKKRLCFGQFLFLVAICDVMVAEARLVRELVESYSATDESVTIPYNVSLIPGSDDLPYDDRRIVRKVHGSAPEQVHLAYFSASEMMVTYVTGSYQMGSNVSNVVLPAAVPSQVRFGATPGGPYQVVTGISELYNQIYTFTPLPNINYTSPRIHHVRLAGLKPSTRYYYIVGDPSFGTTEERSFRTLPAVGQFPIRFGLIGDVGLTYNSSTTLDHLADNAPDLAILVGDVAYADAFMTNGTMGAYLRNSKATPIPPSIISLPFGTFQPKWDMWGRLTEQMFSRVPLQVIVGNHDVEPQFSGRFSTSDVKFVAWKTRYPMPHKESGSSDPNYYSYDVGGVHFIALSPYIPFSKGTPQHQWLEADLSRIDRARTPWVIAKIHAPFYVSYSSHYMENECMRQELEPLLYKHGVDLVLSGHVHAYERTFAVNNFKRDSCAPVHITIGDGGNIEKLYRTYADDSGLCPVPGPSPFSMLPYCPNFPYPGGPRNGFCSTSQPKWSAYRDPSFGHGILVVQNATHAVWEWHRNQDAEDVVSDRTLFVRIPNCGLRAQQIEISTA